MSSPAKELETPASTTGLLKLVTTAEPAGTSRNSTSATRAGAKNSNANSPSRPPRAAEKRRCARLSAGSCVLLGSDSMGTRVLSLFTRLTLSHLTLLLKRVAQRFEGLVELVGRSL